VYATGPELIGPDPCLHDLKKVRPSSVRPKPDETTVRVNTMPSPRKSNPRWPTIAAHAE
jgi:hypothetical protein